MVTCVEQAAARILLLQSRRSLGLFLQSVEVRARSADKNSASESWELGADLSDINPGE